MPTPAPSLSPSPTLAPGTSSFSGGTGIGVISPSFDLFEQAWRSGVALTYQVDAYLDGVPVAAATGMAPTGGGITDMTRPGVRRTLNNLEVVPEAEQTLQGLFAALSPIGTTLKVSATWRFVNRTTLTVPMGVFDIDQEKITEGGGGLSLTAPDKWARIQRASFLKPQSSVKGRDVRLEIKALIQGALGTSEPVVITATSDETMGAQVYDKDRAQTIVDLAKDIGAWVFFDRDGVATIADVPTIGASADWLIDASPSGVLISLERERSRTVTHNVVVVTSTHEDGPKFATQYIWDHDPASPTYAGPGAGVGSTPPSASTAGPFGIVPYQYDTPTLKTSNSAWATGRTILARVKGLANQVSLTAVPNPSVDAFDVIDVLAPRERRDLPRILERHIADTVTHPLTVGEPMQIDGRSTRADEYVDGG